MDSTQELERLKRGPAESGVEDVILRRWSPRAFAERAVTAEDLRKLFEAARWAASSYNEQPWRFLVGLRGDAAYQKIFDCLMDMNQAWAKAAPVLMLSTGKKTFSNGDRPNAYCLHDTGAATANLALQATALGLHAHSMGGFHREQARAAFAIPEDFELGAVTAIGYLGDPSPLPEALRKMEEAPRVRKLLEEFVFQAWGQPASF